jgi:glycosyltransferase involved in cell wall biosynthesis
MNKLISIIIPVYNAELYLNECLDSILKQGVDDEIEIICINDGSTDSSYKILEEYKLEYPNIIVINHENIGPGATRNKGILLATSKYLMFVDSDDWIVKGALKKLIEKIKNRNDDLIEFLSEVIHKNNSVKLYNTFEIEVTDSLAYEAYFTKQNNLLITPWSKLFNRNFVLKNKLKFAENTRFEENQFSIPAYILAKKISNVNLKVYNYRIRDNSITGSKVTNEYLEQFFTQRIGTSLSWKAKSKDRNFRKYLNLEISRSILRSYIFYFRGSIDNVDVKYIFKSMKYSFLFFPKIIYFFIKR